MEVVGVHVLAERAHLLDANRLVVTEFDPDRAYCRGGRIWQCVLLHHGRGRVRLKSKLAASLLYISHDF